MPNMLGGKTFEELGLKIEQSYQRPGPQTRDKTMQIDGKAGLWDFGADIGPKPFNLPCKLMKEDAASLQQSIRALTAHLFDAYGKPKTMKLIFDDEPDVYYNVRFSGHQPISRIVGIGRFSLPLTAFDPYGQFVVDTTSIRLDSALTLESDITLEDQYRYQLKNSSSYVFQINNVGTMAAAPLVQIKGQFSNLSIRANGQSMSIEPFASNHDYKINSGNYSVMEGEESRLSIAQRDFFMFPPGYSTVNVDGDDLDCWISFQFRPKFL